MFVSIAYINNTLKNAFTSPDAPNTNYRSPLRVSIEYLKTNKLPRFTTYAATRCQSSTLVTFFTKSLIAQY